MIPTTINTTATTPTIISVPEPNNFPIAPRGLNPPVIWLFNASASVYD